MVDHANNENQDYNPKWKFYWNIELADVCLRALLGRIVRILQYMMLFIPKT